jgi:hypothetical protein
MRILAEGPAEASNRGCLVDEVHFPQDGPFELIHDRFGLVGGRFRHHSFGQFGDPTEDGHVEADHVLDVRPLDLDHDRLGSPTGFASDRGAVDLGDRAAGEGLGIETAEAGVDGGAKVAFDNLPGNDRVERGDLIYST